MTDTLVIAAAAIERLSAGVWAGGFLLHVLARPVLRKGLPSLALADDCLDEIGNRFGLVRYVLAIGLVAALIARAEAGQTAGTALVRLGAVAALASIAIYVGMVVAPRQAYYQAQAGDRSAPEASAWIARLEQQRRRAARWNAIGAWMAVVVLVIP